MYIPVGILILVLLFLPLDAAFLIGLIFLAFYCFPAFLILVGIGGVIFLLGGDQKKEEMPHKIENPKQEEKQNRFLIFMGWIYIFMFVLMIIHKIYFN